jgi:hypothetical protein
MANGYMSGSGGAAMTEAEWLGCADPGTMLESIRDKVSDRKLRLFAIACCRSVAHLLPDSSQIALQLLERSIDLKNISDEQWRAINGAAGEGFHACMTPACQNANAPRTPACAATYAVVKSCAEEAIYAASGACYHSVNAQARFRPPVPETFSAEWWKPGFRERAALLHEIFGNPFQTLALEPDWLNQAVENIAKAIYDTHEFDRLPILADALEDTGCTNADILAHCRGSGPHVRGCWVIDLILGKS